MDPGRGLTHYLNLGKESTWGTAVTPTRSLRLLSDTLVLDQPEIESEDLAEDYAGVDEVYFGPAKAAGDAVVEANFTGEELLFHDLLGTYDFTINSPGAGQHTHKFWFRPDSTHDFIPGITLEKTLGLTGASNQLRYSGMHVSRLVQEFDPMGFLKHTWSFVGKSQEAVTAAAASFPARLKVRSALATGVTVGAASAKLYGATITWEQPRDEERKHYGQLYIREPVRNDRPTCRFEGELEWSDAAADESADLYELFRAQSATTKAVTFTFTGPVLSGGNYSMIVTIPQAKIVGDTPVAQGRGIVRCNIKARNVGVGANAPYIQLVNATGAKVTT